MVRQKATAVSFNATSRFSPSELIVIIQSKSGLKWNGEGKEMNGEGRTELQSQNSSGTRYRIVYQVNIKDEPGQRHVEKYHHRNDSVELFGGDRSVLRYFLRQEWEYTQDGFDPQTECNGYVEVLGEDPLAIDTCEEVNKVIGIRRDNSVRICS